MKVKLNTADISEIIEMALSDHISFSDIKVQYGMAEKDIVLVMRQNLKRSSYRAWRKRVATFGARRQHYK